MNVRIAPREDHTPGVVKCPLCDLGLVKGDPRGRFTVQCRRCRVIVLVDAREESPVPAGIG